MKKDTILSYSFITLGTLIAALAIDILLIPNTILDGGVVGISMIISKLSTISLSVLVLIINIPFVLVGYKNLGKDFLIRTTFAMITFALFLKLLEIIEPITNEMLLATVFGGALLGIGVGLVIRFGGCVDGTESVALVLTKKLNLSVGQIILIFNLIIYTVAAFLFGIDRALYSILTYFITFKMIDLVSTGLEQTKSAIIITDKGKDLAREIYNKLGRTTTMMEGKGLLSGDKEILYCVLTRIEIYELKKIVSEMDDSAFISIGEVTDIIGNHIKSSSRRLKTIVDEEII